MKGGGDDSQMSLPEQMQLAKLCRPSSSDAKCVHWVNKAAGLFLFRKKHRKKIPAVGDRQRSCQRGMYCIWSPSCQRFNFTQCIPLLLECSSSLTCSSLALRASFLPRLFQECSQTPNSSLFSGAFSPLNSLFGHEFIFPVVLHFKNRHGKMKSGDNVQCCVMRAPALRCF